MTDDLIGRLLKRGTPMASGGISYDTKTVETRTASNSWFWHDALCKEAAEALAARDAEIAALRAEMDEERGWRETLRYCEQQWQDERGTMLATIARLTAGIRDAVEGRYERVPDRTGAVLTCDHGGGATCLACMRAHLLALIASTEGAPEERT